MSLPRFTNVQQKRMIAKLLRRLFGAPVRTCRSLHSCVLCGKDITDGQQYRDRGFAARAHEDCYKEACAR